MRIFSVKSVPFATWSSDHPLNLRPRLSTLSWLVTGLFLFGLGETLLIAAGAGVTPWTVFAQGIGLTFGISVGEATFVIGVGVLLLWVPLKRKPGIGTILNVIIISATIEYVLPFLPTSSGHASAFAMTVAGIMLVGLGSGFYLIANLGPGPRDGLMTGLQAITGAKVAWIRLGIEATVTLIGWLLGGTVGLGTVLFALGIGPAVSAGLYLTAKLSGVEPFGLSKEESHQD